MRVFSCNTYNWFLNFLIDVLWWTFYYEQSYFDLYCLPNLVLNGWSCHDIAEIFLKLALNTNIINQFKRKKKMTTKTFSIIIFISISGEIRATHIIKISSNSFKDATGTVPLKILNTLSLRMALSTWMHTLAILLVNVTSSALNQGSKTTVCHNLISWEQIIHETTFFNNKCITDTTTESLGYEHYLSMSGYSN